MKNDKDKEAEVKKQHVDQKIIPVNIETEMKKSFIDYAMSVIIDRALPDVRDGLKPVHRRILYAMSLLGFTPDKAHRKAAQTVGEVMGKFHPHGDLAVYESLVRMAQDFSLRYTLVDGHGNFGSRDGDPPAAQRYTEARLSKIAMEMLADINKDTVDFKPNYDDHEMEPVVLPSRFPNLLVNGSSGIAVGMATNIPPHNLGEIIDGIGKIIDNPDTTPEELLKIIKGPDFPTAGIILGRQGIKEAYQTGRGRIVVRARARIEQSPGNRHKIIVSELPYQVNKARLIEKIAELVKDKKLEGISDINDESDRTDPVRIVIELKRDANPNVVLNQLYKNTQLQEAFNVNTLAIVPTDDGKYEPRTLNLRQCIEHYIKHQKDVIARRTRYELEKAEAQAHILEGLRIAIDHLDEVINIIRSSRTEVMAKERLIERFSFSEKQAQAIVDMRLGRLTGLEREKLEAQYAELQEKIRYYREVLANEWMILKIVKDELAVIREKYADARRTEISSDDNEIEDEDLIQEQEVAITLTHFGYIKRMSADIYKSQRRGGRGIIGLSTREEDFVKDIFITSTHNHILFFTSFGRVFRMKGYEIPDAGRQAKGTAIVNMLQLESEEKVTTVIPLSQFMEGMYLFMATRNGHVKKTDIMEYDNIRKGGLTAVVLRDDDELIGVELTDGMRDIILVTKGGMSIRFNESDVRPLGRVCQGVRGINLNDVDVVVGMEVSRDGVCMLAVTENGFGKRTELDEYRSQTRSGKGILTYKVTEKTGPLAGMKLVDDTDEVMLISSDGTIIRLRVEEISILGRATQGVTLMRMNGGRKVVGLARIVKEDDGEDTDEVGLVDENDSEGLVDESDEEAEAKAYEFDEVDAVDIDIQR
ncbi:MAG: DNA gyrase subunit A [Clostridiales bacterium]|nr:DNA gyrase subunit A [Clostridiales bacterium]